MNTYLETRWGGGPTNPTVSEMRDALAALSTFDPEHPDTWLTDEDGWTVSAHESGKVYFLDPDGTPLLECRAPDSAFILNLWSLLQQGARDQVSTLISHAPEGRPAKPPDPPPQQYLDALAANLLAVDRAFYDSLGAERAGNPCKAKGCARNAVRFSVLCRVHHFESVRGRPSPFND